LPPRISKISRMTIAKNLKKFWKSSKWISTFQVYHRLILKFEKPNENETLGP
jgi:hypothetical protein